MTTMLEKAAKAIRDRKAMAPFEDIDLARAALLAMRPRTFSDLPEEGLLAGESIIGSGAGGYSGVADVFAAMIDHILNEGEGK